MHAIDGTVNVINTHSIYLAEMRLRSSFNGLESGTQSYSLTLTTRTESSSLGRVNFIMYFSLK